MQEHILIDGYSIIHHWQELSRLRTRNMTTARDALIRILTQFHDMYEGKVTLVFDGRSIPKGGQAMRTDMEIIFTQSGETADAWIEKRIGQSSQPQRYMVATGDLAEQNTVTGLGAQAISPEYFHQMVTSATDDLDRILTQNSNTNRPLSRKPF